MAKQPKVLAGQVAAITGGARGIGRAMAYAFVRQGMKVAIGDLDLPAARQTAEEIGSGTIALELNVTERASHEAFVAEVERQLGPVDVYVNNAGIMQLSRFLDEDDATARRMIDINLHGVLFGMKVVLPGMIARNRGHIVNLASQAGKFGLAGGATYCATKHAVVGLSESVRQELRLLGATGVHLTCVMPTIVNTELGLGVDKPRGQRDIEPEDVANATVDALRTERFEVWVPRENGHLGAVSAMLPRVAREAATRAMRVDRVLWTIDEGKRRDYELRASRSEPGLEPGAQTKELTPGG